ncbi:APC family permease [uncultured Hymenobacter sp.]|uniref:APC family permease n=1 Tax=uncultured Hymenobacter sp. TaxID=170016 RepID=UPI0035CB6B64
MSNKPEINLTPTASSRLRRLLGLGFALAVGVGGTLGTGVLSSPGELARAVPGAGLGLALWLVGGFYTLLAANTLAELAGRRPQAGGWYGYAHAAFGEFAAVAVAWADWTSSCVTGALVALLIGDYLSQLLQPLAHSLIHPFAIALTAVLGLGAVQLRGLREGSRVQEITALALLLGLLAVLGGNAALPAASAPYPPVLAASHLSAAALVAGLQVVIFAYDGWYAPIYFAEETPQPGRTLSKALLGGVGAVLAIYLALHLSLARVLPAARLTESALPLAEVAAALAGPLGRRLTLVVGVGALLGVLNSVLLMATRVLFALGRDGHLPARLARVHAGGTPRAALTVAVVFTAGLALSGTVAGLEAVTSILFVGYYTVGFAALFRVRRAAAADNEPYDGYRAWAHPASTALLLGLSGAFLLLNAVLDPVPALAAALLVAGSYPLWRWRRS